MRRWLVRFVLSLLLSLSLLADSRLPPPVAFAATFSVSKTSDTNDGVCDADCSLREAIMAANASVGADTIILPPGTYVLTQTETLEDAAATGDLDITDDLTILVSPAGIAIIDGGGIDRVFEISNAVTVIVVSMSDITIRNGAFGGTGGIYNHTLSTLTLNNVTVSGNNGFGIYNEDTTATVILNNSTVSGQISSSGIRNDGGTLNINNSTISGNTAFDGGGIHANGGLISLNNATITNNSATNGGGIRRTSGTVLMRNTILAGNSATNGPNCSPASPSWLTSTGYNLLGNNTDCGFASATGDQVGTGGSPIDPLLGPLQNNGGSTLTHALLIGVPNSPALNTGNQSGCVDSSGAALTTDQRSTSRGLSGQGQGGRCDIGAYEVPAVKFANNGAFSVNEVGPTALVTATLEGTSANSVMVNYATSNGTATAGSDYTATSGTLTFTVGVTRTTFNVPITDDTTFEGDQTVLLTLSSPVSATPGSPFTATLTIVDNDPQPTVQFNPGSYTVNETGTAVITVTLGTAAERPITVTYGTSNGTAVAGSDYTATSGPLMFASLQTSKTINVPITPDASDEPNENFTVLLSNPLSATIAGTNPVMVTILDDDLPSVYLPIVMRTYSKFFTGFEVEPNNNTAQANGPLGSGAAINGYPNDVRDYFHFTSGSVGTITVNLTGHTGQGVQLQLFYQSTSNLVTYDPTPPFSIQAGNRPAGFYIVIIYAASGYNSTTPYTLVVTYPP